MATSPVWGDILVLLIDHDTTSIVFLTSLLEKLSYKVMSVNVASEAVSLIEKHNNIGLIIANTEMPQTDPDSFFKYLLDKDTPLILISHEVKTEQEPDFVMKNGCICVKKPYSEDNIKNILQQVLHKKNPNSENETRAQIQDNLKRQRTSQTTLLGRQPISENLQTSEMSRKRRISPNANVGEPKNIWTLERHMKFLAAITVLGVEYPNPNSILKIMNEPNLTDYEVYTYLQKYRAQVELISETRLRMYWGSTNKTFIYPSNYEYPFRAFNLRNNVISMYPLRNKNSPSSSSSNSESSVNNYTAMERNEKKLKCYLGGVYELNMNHPFLKESFKAIDYITSSASNYPTYSIYDDNFSGMGLNHMGGSSNARRMNIFGSNMSHMDWFSSTATSTNHSRTMGSSVTQEGFMHHEASNVGVNHMGRTSFGERYVGPYDIQFMLSRMSLITHQMSYRYSPETNTSILQTNINQMDWVSLQRYVVPPGNMTSAGANTNQVNLVPAQATHATPNNVIGPDTIMEDASLVPGVEDHDVAIEDLISYDKEINEMNMQSCLGDPSHGSVSKTPPDSIPRLGQGRSPMELGSTCQQRTNMEDQREGMQSGENVDEDRELMAWIDELLNDDA